MKNKLKMIGIAVTALFGTGAAFATHRQTVVTPPCSQILDHFMCINSVVTIHCCKDDLTSDIVFGPMVPRDSKK